MKKIGIDARFFKEKSTGVGRHVYELIQGLAQIDHNNQYVIFLKESEFAQFIVPASNFTKEITTAPHYSWQEQWHFLKQIKSHNFDLMVFPQFNAPILYNKPFVVTIHDLTLHLFPGKKKTDFISRLAYKLVINMVTHKAKHCFAVSNNTKQDMISILKIPANKITVTYNGITSNFHPIKDQDYLTEFKKTYSLLAKYFLYTGVSRSHKNITGLIKAFNLFLLENPISDIHLVLAGPIDSTYSEVDDLILELKLKDKVHRVGLFPEDKMSELYNSALAYVFPSFYEGFGIPPLEAMQCGIPVACSRNSSLPEVCGEAVIYFDPYKIEDMKKALVEIAFNENIRQQCIENGFKQCKKFKWSDMVHSMYQIYLQLLNN